MSKRNRPKFHCKNEAQKRAIKASYAKKAAQTNNHFQRHFRKFHSKETTGHPQYVYGENGKDYKALGITESPITNGVSNIPLIINPEPNSNKSAYILPKTNLINKGVRNEKLKGWKISNADKQTVQKVIDDNENPRK